MKLTNWEFFIVLFLYLWWSDKMPNSVCLNFNTIQGAQF